MKTLQLRLLGIVCIVAGLLLLTLLTGCANLRQSANTAIAADAATTSIGIASGVASEGNPLITSPAGLAASVVLRLGLVEYANRMPEPGRTTNLSVLNAVTWGIVASNLGVMALHSTPLGLVIGVGTGWQLWRSTADARAFAAICADEKTRKPGLVCEYKAAVERLF